MRANAHAAMRANMRGRGPHHCVPDARTSFARSCRCRCRCHACALRPCRADADADADARAEQAAELLEGEWFLGFTVRDTSIAFAPPDASQRLRQGSYERLVPAGMGLLRTEGTLSVRATEGATRGLARGPGLSLSLAVDACSLGPLPLPTMGKASDEQVRLRPRRTPERACHALARRAARVRRARVHGSAVPLSGSVSVFSMPCAPRPLWINDGHMHAKPRACDGPMAVRWSHACEYHGYAMATCMRTPAHLPLAGSAPRLSHVHHALGRQLLYLGAPVNAHLACSDQRRRRRVNSDDADA